MYKLILEKQAQDTLNKLQPKLRKRIIAKLKQIAYDPYASHNNVAKLQGRDGYRLRVGDWRILYELQDGKLLLIAVDIKHRGNAYKH